jgi:hypothetical protein
MSTRRKPRQRAALAVEARSLAAIGQGADRPQAHSAARRTKLVRSHRHAACHTSDGAPVRQAIAFPTAVAFPLPADAAIRAA